MAIVQGNIVFKILQYKLGKHNIVMLKKGLCK